MDRHIATVHLCTVRIRTITNKAYDMKKYFIYLMTALALVSFNACSDDDPIQDGQEMEQPGTPDDPDNPDTPDEPDVPDNPDEPSGESNILIAYFTRTNNTGTVAARIAELTGGTLYHIETVVPYPEDYTECTEVAQEELRNGTRPALSGTVDNMEQYDIVFVGCPVWWGDAPMPIWSFLESEAYDFTGKTIIPFCTYASTGRDATLQRIVTLTPDSEHLEGFGTSGRNTSGVEPWLREIGIIE